MLQISTKQAMCPSSALRWYAELYQAGPRHYQRFGLDGVSRATAYRHMRALERHGIAQFESHNDGTYRMILDGDLATETIDLLRESHAEKLVQSLSSRHIQHLSEYWHKLRPPAHIQPMFPTLIRMALEDAHLRGMTPKDGLLRWLTRALEMHLTSAPPAPRPDGPAVDDGWEEAVAACERQREALRPELDRIARQAKAPVHPPPRFDEDR